MVINLEAEREKRDAKRAHRAANPPAIWIALPYLMLAASAVVVACIFAPEEWK